MRPHVKVGGRYSMEGGEIEVDAILPIEMADITPELARASGFKGVVDLLKVAKHGRGENIYLVRFHYIGRRPSAAASSTRRDRASWQRIKSTGGFKMAPLCSRYAVRSGTPAASGKSRTGLRGRMPQLGSYVDVKVPAKYWVDMTWQDGEWRPAEHIPMPHHHATRLELTNADCVLERDKRAVAADSSETSRSAPQRMRRARLVIVSGA